MAAIYNDNTIQYGSITLTIGGVTYVADDFNVDRGSNVIRRTNQLGEPSGSVGVATHVEGTANLQYLTNYPTLGASFSATPDAVIGAETFYITSVGNPLNKDGIKMVPIAFIKAYA